MTTREQYEIHVRKEARAKWPVLNHYAYIAAKLEAYDLIQKLVDALAKAEDLPELNPANYNDDDVMDLNDHGIAASVAARDTLAAAALAGFTATPHTT